MQLRKSSTMTPHEERDASALSSILQVYRPCFGNRVLESQYSTEVIQARTLFDWRFASLHLLSGVVFLLALGPTMSARALDAAVCYTLLILLQLAIMWATGSSRWPAVRQYWLLCIRLAYTAVMAVGILDWTMGAPTVRSSGGGYIEGFKLLCFGGGLLLGVWHGFGLQVSFYANVGCLALSSSLLAICNNSRICEELLQHKSPARFTAVQLLVPSSIQRGLDSEGHQHAALPGAELGQCIQAVHNVQFVCNVVGPGLVLWALEYRNRRSWITRHRHVSTAAQAELVRFALPLSAPVIIPVLVLACIVTFIHHYCCALLTTVSKGRSTSMY